MKKLLNTVLTAGMVLTFGLSMMSVSASALETDTAEHTPVVEITGSGSVTPEHTGTDSWENITGTEDSTEGDNAEDSTQGDKTEDATEDDKAEDATEGDKAEDATEGEGAEGSVDTEIDPIPETPEIVDSIEGQFPTVELPIQPLFESATLTIRQILVYDGEEYVEYDTVEDLTVGDIVHTESYIRDDARVSYTGGAELVEITGDMTISLYYEIA